MAPFPEEVAVAPVQGEPEISILKQRVDLDIDFAGRSLRGSTEITVQPLVGSIKEIRLHCRQCRPSAIQVGGITAKWDYHDPYRRMRMHEDSTVYQHDMLKEKIEKSLRPAPEPELIVTLPTKLKIQELQADTQSFGSAIVRTNGAAETPVVASAGPQGPQYAPIKVFIEFVVSRFHDGLHWVGHADGDRRYPYLYTKAEPSPGNTSCIFPCVDDMTSRCSWELSIRCPRTLGDAFRVSQAVPTEASDAQRQSAKDRDVEISNGVDGDAKVVKNAPTHEYSIDLGEDEAALDLAVVCVGDQVDDAIDSDDSSRHTVSYNLSQPVTARHIGFAVGPFEHVDLSVARGSEEEERLGQTAIKLDGYCLPGKSKDLLNTCYPIAWAVDNMAVKYGSFPFATFQLCFVDDFVYDTVPAAGLSFCNSRLLFPKTVIEPMYRNTRTLIRALADQWMGVNVIAKESADEWVVAGIAGFMTDAYMKDLCGNNEFRWQQKLAAEKVYELDVDRPSLTTLGQILHLDHTIRDFVNVKSALVLFILDRRLMKTTGQTGVQRIINKIFLNAKTGALVNGEVSTLDFQRTCERLGHNKLESFFRQWVFQSGCPIFYVVQRFNKKKLVVEMTIIQKQLDRVTKPPFDSNSFMREIKEYVQEVWAPETNPVFTGPMTIRIHEADGTPYEHIVEIKEATTKLEIPYNTKYKRLKRSRKQKERQMAEGAAVEGGEDALLFCLGDKYQSEEEKKEWNLVDWTEEDEEKMGQESYEWIRMDADFEWIGKIHLVMPLYMYVSQLQQDRDIVAQYESMRYLLGSNPHHVSLSILTRTLMDDKYFWGIREMAADGLAVCAKDKWRDIGQFHLTKAFRELFYIPGTNMPKSNDFSDRRNFVIQCAIPKAMAKLRDEDDKVPMAIRQFFVDLLKFNDNSNNVMDDTELEARTYSDNHYIVTLMRCLSDALIASHREPQPTYTFSFTEEEPLEPEDTRDAEFEHLAIAQIERHRRIDEWDPSYQNLYSITALECLQQLTKAGIVKDKTKELMQYIRSGNADNVRLAAWRCLSEIGMLRKMSAMRYLLHCLAEDPSPQLRDGLLKIFGEALGHIALGEPESAKAAPQPSADSGLVLEQEPSAEARQIEATRKTTPEGAILALANTLASEEPMQEALWDAATSSGMALDEVAALCDIANLMFEAKQALTVKLALPRMWACENLGQGKLKFRAHGPHRNVPRKELGLEDWKLVQTLELKYTGPVSPATVQHQQNAQSAIQFKLKTIHKDDELPDLQIARTPAEMAPPSLATPSTEKPPVKLNLHPLKRKQSMEVSASPRGSSPKAPKISVQQTPTGAAQSPCTKESPTASQRRSSTPGSKPSASKPKRSKISVLRFPSRAASAQDILSAPPKGPFVKVAAPPVQKPVPSLLASSVPSNTMAQFPSPTSKGHIEQAQTPPVIQNVNLFRSYGPPPDADLAMTDVKEESADLAASPIGVGVRSDAKGDGVSPAVEAQGPAPPPVENKAEMPPPPRPKVILKVGRKPSSTE